MYVYITKRHDKVSYILNFFFNKLQIFTEWSRRKRSSPTKSDFWTFVQCTVYKLHTHTIQLQIEEEIVGVERAKVKTRGKLKVPFHIPVSSDLQLPVSNLHDSLHMPCSKWIKLAFNFHKQSACKHNEKHSIAWCSENSNAWWFSFWLF